jgi:uncharacterized protein (TIGR03435 family)
MCVVVAVLVTLVSFAAVDRPSFDAASVKPNTSGSPSGTMRFWPGGRFTASNVPLRKLVEAAYHIVPNRGLVSGGPAWVDSTGFDIEAKAGAGVIRPEMTNRQWVDATKLMLQTLLEQRFKLQTRHETKDMPIYRLVRAKGGVKLTKAPVRDCSAPRANCHGFEGGPGHGIEGHTDSMLDLSELLTFFADRIVRDATGLAGDFDIRTTGWAVARGRSDDSANTSNEVIDPNGPSLFTVLEEQLGLKLEPATGPVDLLVIQSAERPVEN